MQKFKLSNFKLNYTFFAYAIILNIFLAYIFKYREVSTQSVILGYPLPWLTIYNVFKNSNLFSSTNVDIVEFLINTLFYYFLLNILCFIALKFKSITHHKNAIFSNKEDTL